MFCSFNSFTQQICVDNAVVGISSRDDSQPLTPTNYVGTNSDGSELPVKNTEKSGNDTLFPNLGTTTSKYPSQIVSYSSKYVEKISDVSNDMNISGSLSIRYGEISGGGGGSYVNSDTFHSSDLNYLIVVKVVNQTVTVKDQLQFWQLNNDSPENYKNDPSKFTRIYGDTFISGFEEGGIFSAVVSIKALETSNKMKIAADAHLALNIGAGEVKADANVDIAKENLAKQSEVTITVNWSGGGHLKQGEKKWDIDSLQAVAAKFPDLVAECPQRTHAILTKYDSLRTYLTWKQGKDISPLDYEIAQLYTSELLDAYMGYKAIWTDVHKKIQDLDAGVIELIKAPVPKEAVQGPKEFDAEDPKNKDKRSDMTDLVWKSGPVIETFEPDFGGLDRALQMCRSLMMRIVAENDDVTKEPKLAVDKSRPVAYLRPQLFRQLIPIPPPAPSLTTPLYWTRMTFGSTPGAAAIGSLSYKKQTVVPKLLYGLGNVDLERTRNNVPLRQVLNINTTGITQANAEIRIDEYGGGVRYDTTVPALILPINDDGVLGGVWDMPERQIEGGSPLTNISEPVRQSIRFDYPYDDAPPRLVVWLAGFNLGGDGPVNISAKADKVTRDGFDIVVRGSSHLKSAKVCWFAVPESMKNIACGSSETPWAPGLSEKAPQDELPQIKSLQEHVRFLPKLFQRAPKIVTFISGFAVTKELKNIRVNSEAKDISKRGFNWQLATRDDSQLTGASIAWIAVDQ